MDASLVRLSPLPLGTPAAPPRAPKPHAPESLEAVRRLIETTHLSYRVIAARTGIPRATISRHVLAWGWLRPALEESEPPLTPAGRRRAIRGELADRLLRAAEQRVFQVSMDPTARSAAFAQAARLLALAQRLDRPGQPRGRVARAKRLKSARPPDHGRQDR